MIKFLRKKNIEIALFLFFFTYFSIWVNFNLENININNNELNEAINLHKFNPYISYFLLKFAEFFNIKLFLGYILLPSFVVLILYKIFFKLSGSKLWGVSLSLLSIISTENYPFIKFLISFFNFENFQLSFNFYENYEIQGFPMPAFSILYFCTLFYLYFNKIKFKSKDLYILSTLWILGPLVHPFDGLIGLIFWNLAIIIHWKLKKVKIEKVFLIYLILINIIVFFLISNQINMSEQLVYSKQDYSTYNYVFYFMVPLILVILCIKFFKVDLYEFCQKFLGIYLLFAIELIVIIFSSLGYGLDLKMVETRITMFLLHFLYYIPVIYYLNRDSFFLIKISEKKFNFDNLEKKILFITFCKFNKIYLPIFCGFILIYLVGSIKYD